MKTVYFVRHAKSSWEDFSLDDHDRPLNKRWLNDSLKMGKYFNEKSFRPGIIISSSAKRAMHTAERINESLDIDNFTVEPGLYLSSPREIMKIVRSIDSSFDTAMIVSHNPGMTDMVNLFSEENIYNVPTTGAFKVDFDIDDWAEADTDNGRLDFFLYPKMLF